MPVRGDAVHGSHLLQRSSYLFLFAYVLRFNPAVVSNPMHRITRTLSRILRRKIKTVIAQNPESYPISNVPQEIIDSIIDFLRDDRSTLQSCSLVCHTWRARSQYHLFSITVGPPQRNDPIPAFISSIRRSPHFSVRVHELTLCGRRDPEGELDVSARWLSTILENLPNIKTLRCSGISLTGLDRLYTPHKRFKLEHLQFVETGEVEENQTVENILEVLWLFSRIGRITVNRAFAHDPGISSVDKTLDRFASKLPRHLSIGALQVLDHPRDVEFWMALMRRTALRDFICLSLVTNMEWKYETLQPLLKDAGAGLRRLDISFGNIGASAAESLGERIGIEYCTNLQELTIRVFVSLYNNNSPTWSQLCSLLSNITAFSTLRSLTICFLMYEHTNDNIAPDWNAMVQVLRRFTALERIVFVDPVMKSIKLKVAGDVVRRNLRVLGDQVHADVLPFFPPSIFESWWWTGHNGQVGRAGLALS